MYRRDGNSGAGPQAMKKASPGRLHRPRVLMRVVVVCLAFAMVVVACGSGDGAATTTAADSGTTGTTAGQGSGVFFVRVQHQVDGAKADETLSVLSHNGFDQFVKEAAGGGFDVVARGLTSDGAAALIVRLTTDADVPYAGVIFEEG